MFANRYDIEDWTQRYGSQSGQPELGKAADNLHALMEWTDANSDGWPYWSKPSRAATKLAALLQDADKRSRDWSAPRSEARRDITEADHRAALRPVKAFLTRQGVPASTVLLHHA